MTLVGRRFALSSERGHGIFCGEEGLFVGGVPMLQRVFGNDRSERWRPRPTIDLNRDLSKRYGLPIETDSRLERLVSIGRALDRGDLAYAMMATLHLDFPDPPDPTKSGPGHHDALNLSRNLKASGLLKADWDPSKHPRWPVGTAAGIGGEFAPVGAADTTTDTGSDSEAAATQLNTPARLDPANGSSLTPVSFTTTFPWGAEIPWGLEIPKIPIPTEIVPAPMLPPNVNPLHIPQNPYPGRPKCVREWAEARNDCFPKRGTTV